MAAKVEISCHIMQSSFLYGVKSAQKEVFTCIFYGLAAGNRKPRLLWEAVVMLICRVDRGGGQEALVLQKKKCFNAVTEWEAAMQPF